ncbi:DNA polymerase subunit gamma-1-like [Liolophura sinensis]|uniref:DNA polymerase subunit gamma-1-like n=1 Tax=Liolophura sinensis TaxID=3198878 RepID=UPI003158DA21
MCTMRKSWKLFLHGKHCGSGKLQRTSSASDDITWCRRRWFYQSTCCYESEGTKSYYNPLKIQMLSDGLYRQIFRKDRSPISSENSQKLIEKSRNVLKQHDLWGKETNTLPEVDIKLPKLYGENIDDHFRHLASTQTAEYRQLGDSLSVTDLPPLPKTWKFQKGWTRYGKDGSSVLVDFPEENAVVFDIECLMTEGNFPTIATAASSVAWYSWCSDNLIEDTFKWNTSPLLEDLIPLQSTRGSGVASSQSVARIIVGHNVSFDRSFVKEQYYIKKGKLRFLDTMSMHIAVSGFTNFQRVLYQASKSNTMTQEIMDKLKKRPRMDDGFSNEWMSSGTMNNLSDVYQYHCGGEKLEKKTRDIFLEGSMGDVREKFQDLMLYCASDVVATHAVFQKVWPQFFDRFPHPVTFAGMLEMGTAYLPVNSNWNKYIRESNDTYSDLQRELKLLLMRIADDACELLHGERYKDDPWLWDLNWTVKDLKLRKETSKTKRIPKKDAPVAKTENAEEEEESEEDRVKKVLETEKRLPKISAHMPGYPAWYRDLCPRMSTKTESDWHPGPANISTQVRVTPKLMRLTWDGYPVHHDTAHGWGYLVPGRKDNLAPVIKGENSDQPIFPSHSVYKMMKEPVPDILTKEMNEEQFSKYWNTHGFESLGMEGNECSKHWDRTGKGKVFHKKGGEQMNSPIMEVDIRGCWFYKIPHKDGVGKRVGNPLAKDYQNKVEDGTLRAGSGASAERALVLSKMCSYWKNNQERIESQMVVWLQKNQLPRTITRNPIYDDESGQYGAILPRVIPAGTVTRRAVEPTWLTASNAYTDRVGSELKAMVQSPPGYHFVGADVDSQELWIAAVIGDSHFAKMHGCTALGWMTLQGKKADKTDMHSKTAETVGISRDHAKVFNYGRIYGAGQKFAERLLMQFNHRLGKKEAYEKARHLYATTKGIRDAFTGEWRDGSESHMFNKLEAIAKSSKPRTPVLGCRISKTLEPDTVNDDFMTSRVNWVVQSSAVDYLHLMLVSMRWLSDEFDIDARFSISIHDEVRYLVRTEDRYRAALALQITNLLTRAMFAYKLSFHDLPQSVAFFSAVDLDTCLRKEVSMDCVTPSNPHGLERGYGIPHGEALDIYQLLEITNGSLKPQKPSKQKSSAVKVEGETTLDANAEYEIAVSS